MVLSVTDSMSVSESHGSSRVTVSVLDSVSSHCGIDGRAVARQMFENDGQTYQPARLASSISYIHTTWMNMRYGDTGGRQFTVAAFSAALATLRTTFYSWCTFGVVICAKSRLRPGIVGAPWCILTCLRTSRMHEC